MARNPRYDPLFEPMRIGPVVTKNRFYQVPHASGMTNAMPHMRAAFRGVKAEGGWGVVCTGYCSIDPSADDLPLPYGRLWSDEDIRAYVPMVEAVHDHGALAGVELWHGGASVANRYSRTPPLSPSGVPWMSTYPGFMSNQRPRIMDKADIRAFTAWQAEAARRAATAGFDIVYVYAGMSYLPHQFLLKSYNQRSDEYGGKIENRCRLLRELIEATKEAVDGRCAVAVRLSVEELRQEPGSSEATEAHEVFRLLGELPDLWDVKLDSAPADCPSARFSEEGYQEPLIDFVKTVTTKPVVGVGRFTSPDAMLGQIRRGSLDLIGAARPSIADPFLPRKIEEGRIDDIRECIGCNICVSGDMTMSPIRCTQNPTMGEEWRRGWHPERIAAKGSNAKVLVVGGGPAGLECARALGARGYEVALAEAGRELGGRVARECRLPGLSAWGRVRDHRLQQLESMTNVESYLDSRLSAGQILEFGFEHVAVATGASWRPDGVARFHVRPIPVDPGMELLTPDDLMDGERPSGRRVVLYDDDHYYMGGVLAELLAGQGCAVTLVTPAANASNWTYHTLEQGHIQTRLLELGIVIEPHRAVTAVHGDGVETACVFTGRKRRIACDAVVLVTARLPNESLYRDLLDQREAWADTGILSVKAIGDALAPGIIAAAVYAGHRYARELDGPDPGDDPPFKRELTALAPL